MGGQMKGSDVPDLGGLDWETYRNQGKFAQQLQAQAMGQGPSVSELAAQQAYQAQLGNAQSLAKSARGVNPALAQRQAQQAQSQAAMGTAAQAALGRRQEQLNAQAQLGGLYNSMQQAHLASAGLNTQTAAGIRGQNVGLASQAIGGALGGAGAAMGMAQGGMVPGYAEGGTIEDIDPTSPSSNVGKILKGISTGATGGTSQQQPPLVKGMTMFGQGLGKMLRKPGEALMPGGQAKLAPSMTPMTKGGPVPGKAAFGGDNLKNDTVPAMLSPKEIVLPRSVTLSEDPAGNAAKFVSAILASKRAKGSKKK